MSGVAAWIRQRVRRWLGIEDQAALIAGLRKDHEALADAVREVARQLNRTTQGANNTHARLAFYERVVPAIMKAAHTLEERALRAERKAKAQAQLAEAPAVEGEGPESADEMAVTSGE